MAYKPLGHSSLGILGFDSPKSLSLKLDAKLDGKKVRFSYASIFRAEDRDRVPVEDDFRELVPTKLLDIPIYEKCFVKILLSRTYLDWHWRPQDAITTARNAKFYYRQLRYYTNNGWVPNPGDDAQCQVIRFGAMLHPVRPDPKDPFNLNVILEWDLNQEGELEVLPITLDPDIQNPKT